MNLTQTYSTYSKIEFLINNRWKSYSCKSIDFTQDSVESYFVYDIVLCGFASDLNCGSRVSKIRLWNKNNNIEEYEGDWIISCSSTECDAREEIQTLTTITMISRDAVLEKPKGTTTSYWKPPEENALATAWSVSGPEETWEEFKARIKTDPITRWEGKGTYDSARDIDPVTATGIDPDTGGFKVPEEFYPLIEKPKPKLLDINVKRKIKLDP